MDKKTQNRQKAVPTAIRNHLHKQECSNKTIKEYCREKHILPSTFYGWRKRYNKRLDREESAVKTEDTEKQITFASFGALRTQVPHQTLFEISYPTGTSISVYAGTTAQDLAPFLNLLSAGCNALC